MRLLAILLTLILLQPWANAHADRVNWPHFLKINPWTFEPDEVRYPNHSNVDPRLIAGLIALAEVSLTPSGRMVRAAQGISEMPRLIPEQRAVLLRDALDMIHEHQPRWTAFDARAGNGVIFYGGELENKEHLALGVSLQTGVIYRGKISCADLVESSILVDFATSPSWKPMVVTPSVQNASNHPSK
jgi:hypothetical protein